MENESGAIHRQNVVARSRSEQSSAPSERLSLYGDPTGYGAASGRKNPMDPDQRAFTTPTPAARLLERFGVAPAGLPNGLSSGAGAAASPSTARSPMVPPPGKETPWTPNGPNNTHVPYLRTKLNPIFADLVDPAPAKPTRPAATAGTAAPPAWRHGGMAVPGGAGAGGYASRAVAAAAARARATSRQTTRTGSAAASRSGESTASGSAATLRPDVDAPLRAPGVAAPQPSATASRFTSPGAVAAAAGSRAAPSMVGNGRAAAGPAAMTSAGRGAEAGAPAPARTGRPAARALGPAAPAAAGSATAGPKKLSYEEWLQTQVRSPQAAPRPEWRSPGDRHAAASPSAPQRGPAGNQDPVYTGSMMQAADHARGLGGRAAGGGFRNRVGLHEDSGYDVGTGSGVRLVQDTLPQAPTERQPQKAATRGNAREPPSGEHSRGRRSGGPGGGGSRRISGRIPDPALEEQYSSTSAVDGWLRPVKQLKPRGSGNIRSWLASNAAPADEDSGAGDVDANAASAAGGYGVAAGAAARAPPPWSRTPQLPASPLSPYRHAAPGLAAAADGDEQLAYQQFALAHQSQSNHISSVNRQLSDGTSTELSEAGRSAAGLHSPESGMFSRAYATAAASATSRYPEPPVPYLRLPSETDSIAGEPLCGDHDADRFSVLYDDSVRQASMPGLAQPASSTGMGYGAAGRSGGAVAPVGQQRQKLLRLLRSSSARSAGLSPALGEPHSQPPQQPQHGSSRSGSGHTAGGRSMRGESHTADGCPGEQERLEAGARHKAAALAAAMGITRSGSADGQAPAVAAAAAPPPPRLELDTLPSPIPASTPLLMATMASSPGVTSLSGTAGAASQGRTSGPSPGTSVRSHGLGLASEWLLEEGPAVKTEEKWGGVQGRGGAPPALGSIGDAAAAAATSGKTSSPAPGEPQPELRPVSSGSNSSRLQRLLSPDGTGAMPQPASPQQRHAFLREHLSDGAGAGRPPLSRPPLPASRFRSPGNSGNGDGAAPAPVPSAIWAGGEQSHQSPSAVAAGAAAADATASDGDGRWANAPLRQSISTPALGLGTLNVVRPANAVPTQGSAPNSPAKRPPQGGTGISSGSVTPPMGPPGPPRRCNSGFARASAAFARGNAMRHSSRSALLSSVLLGTGMAAAAGEGPGARMTRDSLGGVSTFSALSGPQAGVLYRYPSHGYLERAAELGRWEAAMLYDLDLYDSMQLPAQASAEEYYDPAYSAPPVPDPLHPGPFGAAAPAARVMHGAGAAAAAANAVAAQATAITTGASPAASSGTGANAGAGAVASAAGTLPPRQPSGPGANAIRPRSATDEGSSGSGRRSLQAGGRLSSDGGDRGAATHSSQTGERVSPGGRGAAPGVFGAAPPARASSLGRMTPPGALSPARPATGNGIVGAVTAPGQRRVTGESMLDLLDQLLHERPSGGRFPAGDSRAGTGDGSVVSAGDGALAAAVAAAVGENPGGAVSSGGHLRRLSIAAAAAGATSHQAARLTHPRLQELPPGIKAFHNNPLQHTPDRSGAASPELPPGPPASGIMSSPSPVTLVRTAQYAAPSTAAAAATTPSASSPWHVHSADLHTPRPRFLEASPGAGADRLPIPLIGWRSPYPVGSPYGGWHYHAPLPPTIPEELMAHPLPPGALISPSSSAAGSALATGPPSRQSQQRLSSQSPVPHASMESAAHLVNGGGSQAPTPAPLYRALSPPWAAVGWESSGGLDRTPAAHALQWVQGDLGSGSAAASSAWSSAGRSHTAQAGAVPADNTASAASASSGAALAAHANGRSLAAPAAAALSLPPNYASPPPGWPPATPLSPAHPPPPPSHPRAWNDPHATPPTHPAPWQYNGEATPQDSPYGFSPSYGWHAPPWHLQAAPYPPSAYSPYLPPPPRAPPPPLGTGAYTPPRPEAIQQLLEMDLPAPAIAAAVAVLAGCLPQAWPPQHAVAGVTTSPGTESQGHDARVVMASAPGAPSAADTPAPSGLGRSPPGSAAGQQHAAALAGDATPKSLTGASLAPAAANGSVLQTQGSAHSAPAELPSGASAGEHTRGRVSSSSSAAPPAVSASRSLRGSSLQPHAALLALAGERGMPPKPLAEEEAAGGQGGKQPQAEEQGERQPAVEVEPAGGRQLVPQQRGVCTCGCGCGAGCGVVDGGAGSSALSAVGRAPEPGGGPLARAVRLLAQSLLIVLAGAAGATAAAGSLGAILVRPEDLQCEGCTSIMYGKRRTGPQWAARQLPPKK